MVGSLGFQFGKLILVLGLVLVAVGLLLMAGSRVGLFGGHPQGVPLRLGRLPGDIAYKGKKVSFYFPVVTCLILSAVGTLVLWLISFLKRP
ncbi:MAG TPA: DUF2905 domain-containing protein [Terriglobia bacterium]|nr:DUF2905 domain-containing protein [Terriglobia bacterium]